MGNGERCAGECMLLDGIAEDGERPHKLLRLVLIGGTERHV